MGLTKNNVECATAAVDGNKQLPVSKCPEMPLYNRQKGESYRATIETLHQEK